MKNQITRTLILSIVASSTLLAATPNIGDIEKQIKTPNIEKEKQDIPQIKNEEEYKAPMKDSGKTIFIKSFTFSGNEHINSKEFISLAKDYENKDLTFTQLSELTSNITKYYRDKGYFVARAYIPKQNIQNNSLEIAVIEGKFGEFNLENTSLVKDSIVKDILNITKNKNNIISTQSLEETMLRINDMSGIAVTKLGVLAGEEIGTSNFNISTEKTNRIDGYMVADNAGSKYTGKNRAFAGLNVNSPFEIGDKISLSGLLSNGEDLKNGKVSYTAPLSSNGLETELSYSRTTYSLVSLDEVEDDTFEGTSNTYQMSFNYPLKRTKDENLYFNLGIAKKDLNDTYSGEKLNPRDIKSLVSGLNYDNTYLAVYKPSNITAKFNLTLGNLSFDDENDKANNISSVYTNGNYSKINLDLLNTTYLSNNLSLETALKMQYALRNKNLDGSEDMSVGGSYGVKLYPDGELSAENGYLFNIEAKYQLPNINSFKSSVGVFYDRGKVWMANNYNIDFDSKSLQDAGIGYYTSYDNLFGQVQVAWNTNSKEIQSEANRNSRVLFQCGISF